MIANVLARFEAMSASAMRSCISVPVAAGIDEVTAVYFVCAQSGTFVPLASLFRFWTLMRGSLVYVAWRNRAPIEELGVIPGLFSWKTRFWRRVLVLDAVMFQTKFAGTSTASARACTMSPLS